DAGSNPGALTLGHLRKQSGEAAALLIEQESPRARLEWHRRSHRCRTETKDHRAAQERSDVGDSRAGTAWRGGEGQAISVAFPVALRTARNVGPRVPLFVQISLRCALVARMRSSSSTTIGEYLPTAFRTSRSYWIGCSGPVNSRCSLVKSLRLF